MGKRCFMRPSFCLAVAALAAALMLPQKNICASADENGGREVYIGGMTAGFFLSEEGVRIVGFSGVTTEKGEVNVAKDSPLKNGDRIIEADGYAIKSIADLGGALKKSFGKEMSIKVIRGGDIITLSVSPIKDVNGRYKLGILIRDNISGIGTVTYIMKDNLHYGALGHEVFDENSVQLSIADDNVYPCSIVGINKGKKGKAGELKGIFLNEKPFATAETICDTGIYGTFSSEYDMSKFKVIHTASSQEAHIGKATIYSTLSGTEPKEYDISIVKVDKKNRENKNYVIKIEDDGLMELSGGIVQGMSGSPIIQDGKMIGAVTHVFLNDPSRGYGIDINNMLKN